MVQQSVSERFSQPDPILSPHEVSARLGLSLPTIWRLRRRGDFPEPLPLSPGRVGYRQSAIERWLEDREAGGRQAGA